MQNTNRKNDGFQSGFTGTDALQISKALELSGHTQKQDILRPSGIDAASILQELNADLDTILAALLSDPLLIKPLEEELVREKFGATVAVLVKDVNWLNSLKVYTPEMADLPNQTETLRRMLLSMTHDARAVLIKLAFRLQRLRLLNREDDDLRRWIARETLDIYAPIANRLGIGQLKWEMEDLSFRYLDPQNYRKIANSLAADRNKRERCIAVFKSVLQQNLAQENISAETAGRPKHIYSIWKKMQRKQLDIDELYDLLAVRVIVGKLSDCYAVLGIVHGHWQYIPKEFDDYIANPKKNGYQSLHTVILDQQGNRIEIQIRTRQMHEFAELGVAAHWRYKEGGKQDTAAESSISSLRLLLDEKAHDDSLIDNFRTELFYDRVYVLTPAGKLLDLSKGSTPLDFAYAVHTEVGHRCRGAKVNGRITPLTYQLQSGDRIEILTVKTGKPNRNWIDPNLGYLKSARAIGKIKAWFRQQDYQYHLNAGKQILDKESHRLGLDKVDLQALAKHFSLEDSDKLLIAIGRGDINSRQIAGAFQLPESEPTTIKSSNKRKKPNSAITVDGVDNILTHFAQCCNPLPGDNIIGYISQSKGITIHRSDCANVMNLEPEKQNRLIDVSWGKQSLKLAVPVVISAYNRQGLLNDVTQILNVLQIDILDAQFYTEDDLSATLELELLVLNTEQLSHALSKIGQLPNIIMVKRKT